MYFLNFVQIASPACTELEVVMMDWLGKLLGLPKEFLASSGGKGGGVIQVNKNITMLIIHREKKMKINFKKRQVTYYSNRAQPAKRS